MGKICYKCKIEKDFGDFYKDKNKKDGLDIWCKECKKDYDKSRSEARKEYRKKYRKERKLKMAECLQEEPLTEEERQEIRAYQKEYYIKNKAKVNARNQANYRKNKAKVIKRQREYRQANKETYREQHRNYANNRRKEDPTFRMRGNVSSAIYRALKRNNSRRYGKSYFNKLPYKAKDLREHLESFFEPWMNWENYGPYTPEKRTWQVDHITPQSALPYTSPEDENFQKCWALENLRPLEAMENIKKSNKEIEYIEKYSAVMENIRNLKKMGIEEPPVDVFVQSKVCYKCKLEKDRSEFGKRSSSKDGLHQMCKECKRKTERVEYKRARKQAKAELGNNGHY